MAKEAFNRKRSIFCGPYEQEDEVEGRKGKEEIKLNYHVDDILDKCLLIRQLETKLLH